MMPMETPAPTLAMRKSNAFADVASQPNRAQALFDSWVQAGPHRVVEGIQELLGGQYAKGANSVITGAGLTALPMVAPQVGPAVMAAPGAAALTVGAGLAAQQAVPPIARSMGASPDQAELAGTVASLGAGTAMAKVGVPALARWSTTKKAAQMGKAYQQATRDIQAALGVNAEDVHAARPFLEAVHTNAVPIVGKEANGGAADQFVKAANVAVEEIEGHVSSLIQQFPQARVQPMGRSILSRVGQMPGAANRPSDKAAALRVVAQNGLNRPLSLADAESLRVRLNAENRSVLEGTGVRQRTAVLSDPAYVARQEAANQLRDGIYGALEQHGVQGVRELRRGEGAVLKLRNAADPLTRGLRSESTVARTGETSLPRRVMQRVAQGIGASAGLHVGSTVGHPIIGAMTGAELASDVTSGLVTKNLSKNALLERAFRQMFTSPPVMSVQGFRAPGGGGGMVGGGQMLLKKPDVYRDLKKGSGVNW